jgi:hypothetical protein
MKATPTAPGPDPGPGCQFHRGIRRGVHHHRHPDHQHAHRGASRERDRRTPGRQRPPRVPGPDADHRRTASAGRSSMSTPVTTARTGRTRRCVTTRPPDVGHTRSGHECPVSTARPDRRPDPGYAQAAYGDTAFGTHTLHGACRAMAAARTAPAQASTGAPRIWSAKWLQPLSGATPDRPIGAARCGSPPPGGQPFEPAGTRDLPGADGRADAMPRALPARAAPGHSLRRAGANRGEGAWPAATPRSPRRPRLAR